MSERVFVGAPVAGVVCEQDPSTTMMLAQLNDVVSQVFRAGLALDSVQQAAESEYGKSRAATAAAALDEAMCQLRQLAATLVARDNGTC